MCQAQNKVKVNIWSSLPQDCIHSPNILFFPKSARWWRRPWVGEPRELCTGGSAGKLFLLTPSLPIRRPLPHLEGNSSIKRARWTAAERPAAPFRPHLQERVSEVKKYRNSRTTRGAGGGQGRLRARGGSSQHSLGTTDVFLLALGRGAPAPGVPAFVCPGFRGRDYAAGAAAATRGWGRGSGRATPGLLCWLLGLGLDRRFIRWEGKMPKQ